MLTAPARLLEQATAKARVWLEEHAERSTSVPVPPEVVGVLRDQLPGLLKVHYVRVAFEEGDRSLRISGPDKLVGGLLTEVQALVRQHAHEEAVVELSLEETALVQIHLRSLRALREGVFVSLQHNEKKVVLKGTADPLGEVRLELEKLLDEAEGCAVQLTLNSAQMDRLHRPPGREREVLVRKLQEQHEVALIIDRSTMLLSMRGRAAAVASAQRAMEAALDVDEHERTVPMQTIPVIIGKGGSNIKRLKQDSGATFDLDRTTGRLRIQGSKTMVAKGCELLDELLEQNGGALELRVQPRQIPLIIGRGGSTIRQLQQDSGASIAVQKEESVVRMRGSMQAVEMAKLLIEQLLAPPSSNMDRSRQHAPAPPPGLGGPPPGLMP